MREIFKFCIIVPYCIMFNVMNKYIKEQISLSKKFNNIFILYIFQRVIRFCQ